MALRWRVKRLTAGMAVVVVVCCAAHLLYWNESTLSRRSTDLMLPANTAELHVQRPSSATYINRPASLSSAHEQIARRQLLQRACVDGPEGSTMDILMYERKPSVRMSYCVVPKAGCTFWIRIFRFVNNDTGERLIRSPWEMGRRHAHDASQRRMRMHRLQNARDRLLVMNNSTTRFMMARDPYSRLWSAYLDKLLLPGFWTSTGRKIVARRSQAGATSLTCGNDVTFREFVEFIVDQSKRGGSGSLNGHWRPIQYVCDPCQFKPFFIGKQETFLEDSRFILEHFGLQHLLEGYDSNTYRRDEVSILTDYNLVPLEKAIRHCATPLQIAQRLWAVFQLNGLLPPSSNISAVEELPAITRAAFKQLVYHEQERHWGELQHASGAHRRRMMAENYRALPVALLERLAAVYSQDFLYFGYQKRPPDMFGSQ